MIPSSFFFKERLVLIGFLRIVVEIFALLMQESLSKSSCFIPHKRLGLSLLVGLHVLNSKMNLVKFTKNFS